MRRKKLSKAVAVTMAIMMAAMSLTACGGGSKKSDTPNTQTEKPAGDDKETTAPTESAQETPKGDPVKIRIFSTYASSEETRASKFYVEQLEKELNIELIRDDVPNSAYAEKLQLALTDGDYPDAFIFNSHSDPLLLNAVDNGLIVPINDYLDGMDNIKNYIYPEAFEAAKVKNDDNIYLIPRCTVARADGFAVRQDWLEKTGVEITSDNLSMTPDEFLAMLEKFTTQDPDGDGKANTYGFLYTATKGMINNVSDGAFDCLGWQKSSGEYAYMDPMYEIGNENYRKSIEFSQKVYKYAHPDSVITTDADALVFSGQVGSLLCFPGHVSSREQNIQKINPDAKVTYISGISNSKGEVHGKSDLPGIWGGLAITSACKNPQKVVEMVNWLLSDQAWEYSLYGEPGYSYNKKADGTYEVMKDQYLEVRLKNWASNVARRKEDTNYFLDLSLAESDLATTRKWLDIAVDAVVFTANFSKQPASVTDTEFVEMENKRKEVLTKIIMGALDISEYDKVLEEWYAKGGKQYVEDMNALITAMHK